jgi:hypothetical protein
MKHWTNWPHAKGISPRRHDYLAVGYLTFPARHDLGERYIMG